MFVVSVSISVSKVSCLAHGTLAGKTPTIEINKVDLDINGQENNFTTFNACFEFFFHFNCSDINT